MNKKSIIKMSIMTIISASVGAVVAISLLKLSDSGAGSYVEDIQTFLLNHAIELHVLIIVSLLIPALFLYIKGKKVHVKLANASEEEMDAIEKLASKYFDLSVTLNGVFLTLNFMVFGTLYNQAGDQMPIIIALFMIGSVAVSSLEIAIVRFMQKNDSRLKGDPTSMKFEKDFLGSLDEAEQLKVYKAGYNSFKVTKLTALVFVILTILFNVTLETGAFPVFISCLFLLVNIWSFSYYGMKEN